MPTAHNLAIVGATATGKTDVAERVAATVNGEIVCADSRQVFRELEIGTGKPVPAERARWPHHLFDALSIGDSVSAGWYAEAARSACAGVHARGRTAVFVGGSGLYVHAARSGLASVPLPDPAVRNAVLAELEQHGSAALHEDLRTVDPETAARLSPRDARRVGRALEVVRATGRPLSWWHRQPHVPPVAGTWRVVELTRSPSDVRKRIEARTSWMFESGLIEETRAILASPLAAALRRLRAIGYDEAIDLIEGRVDRAAAEARTSLRTAQLAKRQRTWFRHQMDGACVAADGRTVDALVEAVLVELQVPQHPGTSSSPPAGNP